MDQAGFMRDVAFPEAALDAFTYHGGNVDAARRLYPDSPAPWIDLSTGINPHPYPLPALPREAWTRLPDGADIARLEAIAARRYGAARTAGVIAGPGSQVLIQMIARLKAPAHVGIFGQTYSGHAQAWRAAGALVETIATLDALAGFDVAVIVNPNNPDGRLTPREDLLALHRRLARGGGMLIVDEAFVDLAEGEASLAPALPEARTIVLRSFGKTYGFAGLRLGFAICSSDLAAPLRSALGAWPVSGPAIAIGAAALADAAWLERMRPMLEGEAARLEKLLAGAGAQIIGGTSLFRLIRHREAKALFARLLAHGILARPFAETPDRLRFGLPAGAGDRARLERALASFSG
jgi:cobalamin biosynthesis protein CobC